MSQIGRSIKHLEAPRPLKPTKQIHQSSMGEIQSIDELMTLTEKMANVLVSGHDYPDSMNILLTNLRTYGPELEAYFKDALDRAFVAFRNASQDERLTIISRMNLLELIELRAKSWQVTDETSTYYKHKATDVLPDNSGVVIDLTLGTSPPSSGMGGQILGPGELIRTSGKFPRPTKIPGKNYSKDEVVIRNADSGKVMGIKGRRVHMIEELSETIISFQRVNPGAKERLVQITGPSEEKINYARQLIEDTIRRNASPVRLEVPQSGSCSSLASSTSDEAMPRACRNITMSGASGTGTGAATTGGGGGSIASAMSLSNFNVPNQSSGIVVGSSAATNSNSNAIISGGINIKSARNSGGHNMLLHSLSTNDASLGEYKYTVGVGNHNIKITGDCFELVRIAKLVLDDYFSSNEFLASVEAGAGYDGSSLSATGQPSKPTSFSSNIPGSHQLDSSSPFADSGIGLNILANSTKLSNNSNNNSYIDMDDDVFIINNADSMNDSSSTTASLSNQSPSGDGVTPNGLTRSRRSHFSLKDTTTSSINMNANKNNANINNAEGNQTKCPTTRIVHKYERLIRYAKSPHSWVLPKNWTQICDSVPSIIRNKDIEDEKSRFDADKYLANIKIRTIRKMALNADESNELSPDRE